MLAIRMQRTGRKGHAMFRLVVQDSRLTPTSGKVVAFLGSYDPHSKQVTLNKDKASFYLDHGAQPSERAVRLLQGEGVKLPKWVVTTTDKQGKLRHPDKLRRNRPDEPTPAPEAAAPEAEAAEVETPAVEEAPAEAPETEVAATTETDFEETVAETAPAEEPAEAASTEAPAEEVENPAEPEAAETAGDDAKEAEK